MKKSKNKNVQENKKLEQNLANNKLQQQKKTRVCILLTDEWWISF